MTMTYNSLTGAGGTYGIITDWLERGQNAVNDAIVNRNLNNIVNNAERRIAADIKIQGFINPMTSNFTQGLNAYQKPDRWRETISVNFGSGPGNNVRNPIYPRSYEYIRTVFPDDTQQGPPQFYADYNYGNWLFGPTPDQNYPYEVIYYELPVLLGPTVQNNYLTDYAPLLLQYASLYEANILLKDDGGMQKYAGLYHEILASMSAEDIEKIKDRSNERMKA